MVTKDERRRQLARQKYERQQQRRVEQRRRARRRNSLIAAGLAVVLAGGGAVALTADLSGDDGATTAADASASPSVPAADDPCRRPAGGEPSEKTWKKEPALDVDTSADYTMELRTTCGDISFTMDAEKAPRTVNSFAFLADRGYFDHSRCHRLTTEGIHVLQCGDPTGSGAGGPGYNIPDENLDALGEAEKDTGAVTYPAGTVAMANTGEKDSGGSQFFLVYEDSMLPPQYTPFGTVSEEGMDVLRKIAAAGVQGGATDGAPNATVVVDEATVRRS